MWLDSTTPHRRPRQSAATTRTPALTGSDTGVAGQGTTASTGRRACDFRSTASTAGVPHQTVSLEEIVTPLLRLVGKNGGGSAIRTQLP